MKSGGGAVDAGGRKQGRKHSNKGVIKMHLATGANSSRICFKVTRAGAF